MTRERASELPVHGGADPVLAEIVDRLVRAYQPTRVYLFGSRARGDARPDSDYDLLVIVPDSSPRELRDSGLAYESLWGRHIPAPVEIVVTTESRFSERSQLAASLAGAVRREGRLLYGRP